MKNVPDLVHMISKLYDLPEPTARTIVRDAIRKALGDIEKSPKVIQFKADNYIKTRELEK